MLRHAFHAMGTTVEALLEPRRSGGAAALLAVEVEFERLEAILSRFRPESALSRLNREGRVDNSPELARVVELTLDAREKTAGRFDPTVLNALVAAGYDRTYEDLPTEDPSNQVTDCHLARSTATKSASGQASAQVTDRHLASLGVRVEGAGVALQPGVCLDLGGIGKGYAVDRAVERLSNHGSCLVNAGGDIAVAGVPCEGMWAVALETPAGPVTLGLASGGLATSGRDRRRWTRNGEERHHLIDPASGRSAESPWLRVTVAAPSAVAAEVVAKDVFLGADPAGTDAVLVARDGTVTRTGALA
jgi:thiamine biosynthesis lipoprotein